MNIISYKNYIFLNLYLLIIWFFLTGCINPGITIIIKNTSTSQLDEIIIEFTGGKELIADLEPGQTIKKRIHPNGESSLTVTYTYGEQTYRKKVDVYFEPGYKGKIRLVIGKDGELSISSQISL